MENPVKAMKIVSASASRLVIGDRGLGSHHWGYFMTLTSGTILTVLFAMEKPVPAPAMALTAFFLIAGLFAALFMRKRLTHILDKSTDTLRIEYPARFDTKLEIETVKLSSVREVRTERQSFLAAALAHSADRRGPRRGTGFVYVLEDGRTLDAGLYSTDEEEITPAVEAVARILGLSPAQ